MNLHLQEYINNIIKSNNYDHFLIHGAHGSGKKTLFKTALHVKNLVNYKFEKFIYKKEGSNYFFDSYYINIYRHDFLIFIKEICSTDFDYKKHIFITNSEFIQPQIYEFLRRFLEVNCENNKFFFICCSIRGPIEAIKSRCLFIRVPYPDIKEYEIFIKKECRKIGIKYKKQFLKERNIQKMLDILLLESIGAEYIDNIQIFCKNIIDNIDNYTKIQELVREIVKNGFDCREIMKTFADYICNQEVYKLVTEHDHKLAMGYRELIHMEALFYDIHLLLKKSK